MATNGHLLRDSSGHLLRSGNSGHLLILEPGWVRMQLIDTRGASVYAESGYYLGVNSGIHSAVVKGVRNATWQSGNYGFPTIYQGAQRSPENSANHNLFARREILSAFRYAIPFSVSGNVVTKIRVQLYGAGVCTHNAQYGEYGTLQWAEALRMLFSKNLTSSVHAFMSSGSCVQVAANTLTSASVGAGSEVRLMYYDTNTGQLVAVTNPNEVACYPRLTNVGVTNWDFNTNAVGSDGTCWVHMGWTEATAFYLPNFQLSMASGLGIRVYAYIS